MATILYNFHGSQQFYYISRIRQKSQAWLWIQFDVVLGKGYGLKSACKQYGAHILISEYTYKEVKATYRTRQVDYVIVKGKTEPVGVYEVLDFHDDTSYPNLVEALGIFNDGYRCWNEAKWDQAVKLFKDVKKLNPNDKAAQLYLDRGDHMKKNPPKGDWNGVWVMTTK